MVKPYQSTALPFEQLYIYYLEGHLSPDYSFQSSDFIGTWEEDGFSFLFFCTPADDRVNQALQTQPQLTLLDRYNISYEEWLGEKPTAIDTGRFYIVPPWEPVETPGDRLPIIIDPGVVFGSGTHSTTRDCLEALDLAWQEQAFDSVLDIGTGTGLLAIAAARLGCRNVLAVDLNHLAALTARKNVVLNHLENSVLVAQGRAEACSERPVDLLVANIHYDVMKHILDSPVFTHATYFILSGLLRSQAKAITGMPILQRADMIRTWEKDGIWHTFFGKIVPG